MPRKKSFLIPEKFIGFAVFFLFFRKEPLKISGLKNLLIRLNLLYLPTERLRMPYGEEKMIGNRMPPFADFTGNKTKK